MKILFFIPRLTQGGAERQVAETAELLAARGHEICVCVYNLQDQHYNFHHSNVHVINFNIKLGAKVRCQFLLYLAVKKFQPDFAISYQETANKYLGRVATNPHMRKATRFIASERNSKLRYAHSHHDQKKYKSAYRNFDGFTTNSTLTKSTMVKLLGVEEHRIFLLRNLVDTERFQPEIVKRELISEYSEFVNPNNFLILVPARIIEAKNQGILVDVAKRLHSLNFSDFQFLFAGIEVGSYADLVRKQIKANHLEKHFVFLNSVPEAKMSRLYNLADLVFLPSLWEGLSNSVIEALACGRIVLSTNVSDINQIITDGKDGFIVEINAVEEIAEKILSVVHMGREKRMAMQQSARSSAERLGPNSYYNEFMSILGSIKAAR